MLTKIEQMDESYLFYFLLEYILMYVPQRHNHSMGP